MTTTDAEPQGQGDDDSLVDPISTSDVFEHTESRMAIYGHPIHAAAVAFPIALTFCTFGADALYWWTGDQFWARAAVWAAGTAFLFGLLAGATGTLELLMVPGIRAHAAAWTHFAIAVLLLAFLGANWGHRLDGYETAVLPWGLLLSAFNVLVVAWTGWHGGALVFDHRLGTSKGN